VRHGRGSLARALLATAALSFTSASAQMLGDPESNGNNRVVSRRPPELPCRVHPNVWWQSLSDAAQQETLDRWCTPVGPPIVSMSAPNDAAVTALAIVSWNMDVGGGRLEELVASIRTESTVPSPDLGIVLLLQEAFRSGPDIPPIPEDGRVPRAIRPHRPTPDVMASALALGMSAVYVPSMRNGDADDPTEREDRGNALLSTEPLSDIRALELPFGKQRRVAVTATVTPRGGGRPVRIVSMHFDTNSDRATQSAALATFLSGLGSPMPIIAGGDLNSLWGRRDSAFIPLGRALSEEACGSERTNTWPWRLDILFGWWRGRIDFIFSTLGASISRSCRTESKRRGSDHKPVHLLLNVT
jgi:endonuclease/exonuclease/phosphatase family metal-dependent hydrolase